MSPCNSKVHINISLLFFYEKHAYINGPITFIKFEIHISIAMIFKQTQHDEIWDVIQKTHQVS